MPFQCIYATLGKTQTCLLACLLLLLLLLLFSLLFFPFFFSVFQELTPRVGIEKGVLGGYVYP